MNTPKTYIEKQINFDIECLRDALYQAEANDNAWSRDYSIMKKRLKVLEKASKKLAKLSAKRQKLVKKCLQGSDNLV